LSFPAYHGLPLQSNDLFLVRSIHLPLCEQQTVRVGVDVGVDVDVRVQPSSEQNDSSINRRIDRDCALTKCALSVINQRRLNDLFLEEASSSTYFACAFAVLTRSFVHSVVCFGDGHGAQTQEH